MEFFRAHFDYLRTALMCEPRGHSDMVGAVLVRPSDPRAALAAFFVDAAGYLTMCGHGTMGLVTVALEEGLLSRKAAEHGAVETPAGLVRFRAALTGSRVREVTLCNVPSFLFLKSAVVALGSPRSVSLDVAYGGNWFALVDARQFGLKIVGENLRSFVELGMSILSAVNRTVHVEHPTRRSPETIDLVEFYDEEEQFARSGVDSRNVVIFGKGQCDRSPCGTGLSARMAALYARGQLALHDDYFSSSILGSVFRGRLIDVVDLGSMRAVIPEITGRAWITGRQTLIFESDDPLAHGFEIRDAPCSDGIAAWIESGRSGRSAQ
jgi:proline racemase